MQRGDSEGEPPGNAFSNASTGKQPIVPSIPQAGDPDGVHGQRRYHPADADPEIGPRRTKRKAEKRGGGKNQREKSVSMNYV